MAMTLPELAAAGLMDPGWAEALAPVAARGEHQQIGVGHLDALGDRQRAAVDAVEAVGRGVAGDPARAADARHESDLVRRPAHRRQGTVDRLHDAEIAASGAPCWRLLCCKFRYRRHSNQSILSGRT